MCFVGGCAKPTLREAAGSGDLRTVEYLIKNGADVKKANGNGLTALHSAAVKGNLQVMDALVKAGADVNAQTDIGQAPITFAVSNDHIEAVEYLLSHGADIHNTTKGGFTLVHKANSIKMIHYLMSKGLMVDAKMSGCGMTPFMLACQDNQPVDFINGLIRLGAKVELRDYNGATALHYAASGGSTSIIKLLLAKGLKAGERDKYGYTPLHYAAEGSGDEATAKALISNGASVYAKTKDGMTAKQLAIREMSDLGEFLTKYEREHPKSTANNSRKM